MRFKEIEKQLTLINGQINDYLNTMDTINNELEESNKIETSGLKLRNRKRKSASSEKELISFIETKLVLIELESFFSTDLSILKENYDYYTVTEINNFRNALESINTKINLVININERISNDNDIHNYILGIKLPNYEYFKDVVDFTKQINFIFSTVLQNNRKAKLVGFDKGSEWYQLALENILDFKVMTIFISEVVRYVRIILEDKRRESELTLEEDAKRMILENMKSNQMLIQKYAIEKVLIENGNLNDEEEFSKHQRAFENMAELMLKGTVVEIDKEKSQNNREEGSTEIPRLENVQELLTTYRELLIEHNSNESNSDE